MTRPRAQSHPVRRARALRPLLLAAALAAGCSLLPEPDPAPRVFTVPLAAAPARAAGQPLAQLRVRTVAAAAHLDENVAWRHDLEVGARPHARWSERPDVVLRRALLAQLFGDGRLVRSEGLDAPLVDVELLAFEEVLGEGPSVAQVVLQARVLDEARHEVLAGRFEASRPLPAGDGPDEAHDKALARALGECADEVCARLAADVVAAFGG
jgi:ABC-type uncharacterized transport system auxiliary subunit